MKEHNIYIKGVKMNHEIINFEWKLSIMDLHESKSTFFFNLIKLIWNETCISNNAKLHVYCFKVKKKKIGLNWYWYKYVFDN